MISYQCENQESTDSYLCGELLNPVPGTTPSGIFVHIAVHTRCKYPLNICRPSSGRSAHAKTQQHERKFTPSSFRKSNLPTTQKEIEGGND
jgi:hypothetical protein